MDFGEKGLPLWRQRRPFRVRLLVVAMTLAGLAVLGALLSLWTGSFPLPSFGSSGWWALISASGLAALCAGILIARFGWTDRTDGPPGRGCTNFDTTDSAP